MTKRFFQMALMLGLLSAIGPFAIDMYLPALPTIGKTLDAPMSLVQLSLTSFFIAVGIGQLLYGPLSDWLGRKPPLLLGLIIFAAASVGCALATDVYHLIFFRFLQGIGAAAGMAIPRAVVRDLHTGPEAAKLMALLMLVFSVSPILAPLVGSFFIEFWDWRGVFWFVLAAALIGMVIVVQFLPETWGAVRRNAHPTSKAQNAAKHPVVEAFKSYGMLIRDWRFLGLVMIGGFTMSGFFSYLMGSSFVMIDHFKLTSTQYSIAFGVNAIAFFGMAQFNGTLGKRFGLDNLVRFASLAGFGILLTSTTVHALGVDNLWVLIAFYFASSACFAMVVPNTAVLALDLHGATAGSASALMGTLQMLTGAIVMGISSLFTDGTPLRMVMGTFICATIALCLTVITLGLKPTQAHKTD